MKHRILNEKLLSNDSMLQYLKNGADLYAKYVGKDLLFIFRQGKEKTYDYYEIYFGAENFMHLAGIKSKSVRAEDFFALCVSGTVRPEDCNPKHSVNNRNSKIMRLEKLLDFCNSKCYKIGSKDLITKDNDFEMAIGNDSGIVGFDSRVSPKGSKEIDKKHLPIPVTLLANPITQYSSNPQKIMFILQKEECDTYYKDIFYEIKNGLLKTEAVQFSDELQQRFSFHDSRGSADNKSVGVSL